VVTNRILRIVGMTVIASCAVVRLARAQSAEAELLFDEADRLMTAGKVAEACDAFEASNRIEARAGTLIRLGQCREQNHQLASAWSAYRDALSRAKDPNKRRIATGQIAAIEPRLSYLTVIVSDANRVDGLAIARNGKPLDRALWNRALPIDGGDYEIVSTAVGHDAWTTRATVPAEGGKVVVETVKLQPQHKPADAAPPEPQVHADEAARPVQRVNPEPEAVASDATRVEDSRPQRQAEPPEAAKPAAQPQLVTGNAMRGVEPVTPAPRPRSAEPAPPELHARSVDAPRLGEAAPPAPRARSADPPKPAVPIATTVPGGSRSDPSDALAGPRSGLGGRRKVALGVAGIGGGALAAGVVLGLQAKARAQDAHALCPEPTRCGEAAQANALIAQGQSKAMFANVSYGVAAACVVSAAVLWFTGGAPAPDRLSVAPRLGHSPGVDVMVRF